MRARSFTSSERPCRRPDDLRDSTPAGGVDSRARAPGGLDLKEKFALFVLLSFIAGTVWLAVEHGLESEEICPPCAVNGSAPPGTYIKICGWEPFGGTSRTCPQCDRKWKASGSSIAQLIRNKLAGR